MLCGEATLIGEAGGRAVASALSCNRWSCTECEVRNRAKVIALIIELDPTVHITFTSNPHWLDGPDARARRLREAVSLCRRRLRREFGQAFDFIGVFAATERGEPHIHTAMRCPSIEAKALQRMLSR